MKSLLFYKKSYLFKFIVYNSYYYIKFYNEFFFLYLIFFLIKTLHIANLKKIHINNKNKYNNN